jgi:hypothetical protein
MRTGSRSIICNVDWRNYLPQKDSGREDRILLKASARAKEASRWLSFDRGELAEDELSHSESAKHHFGESKYWEEQAKTPHFTKSFYNTRMGLADRHKQAALLHERASKLHASIGSERGASVYEEGF